MTRDELLRELLVERFGKPVRQYRASAVEDTTSPPAQPVPELAAVRRRKTLERALDDTETTTEPAPKPHPKPASKWAAAVRRYEAAVVRTGRETA